jgi:hypothetical protein
MWRMPAFRVPDVWDKEPVVECSDRTLLPVSTALLVFKNLRHKGCCTNFREWIRAQALLPEPGGQVQILPRIRVRNRESGDMHR